MRLSLLTILLIIFVSTAQAQVTIGSEQAPNKGALLDLKQYADGSSELGLAIPRVELVSLSTLQIGKEDYSHLAKEHTALIVYNTVKREDQDRLCPGLHVWDGQQWLPLTAYPIWEEKKELVEDKLLSFKHLDHNIPADWPADKKPISYPLGYMGTFIDNREGDTPQEYYYSRFYVGLATRARTYALTTSYSCDPNNPVYIEGELVQDPPREVFEDGVWMADHLRAKHFDTKRDEEGEVVAEIIGPNYNIEADNSLVAWAYPENRGAIYKDNGLLYTWAAATNDKSQERIDEGGLVEGLQVQGICPNGWHLPSDRQWTDLENALIINTKKFSDLANIGEANMLTYDKAEMRGKHATALISKEGGARGKSLLPDEGGFSAIADGFGKDGSGLNFGRFIHTWSSSSANGDKGKANEEQHSVWCRIVDSYIPTGIKRTNGDMAAVLKSVRCKKNTD